MGKTATAPASPLDCERPGPGVVDVWVADATALRVSMADLRATLSAEECARADRYRFDEDRARYTVGRGLARRLLGQYLGMPGKLIALHEGPSGKPIAQGAMPFNISHSGDLVLLAFASDREVGVDVEELDPTIDLLALAASFFSTAETAALRAHDGAERIAAFFRCWTRKEAFLKGTGVGLSYPLDGFDVSLEPGCLSALRRVAWDPAEAGRWQVRDLAVRPGYAAALAVEGGASEVTVRSIPA